MKFQKISDPAINPVLGPIEETSFKCPVRRKEVNWEAKDVFNPAAVVKDNKVYLLYRAEDRVRGLWSPFRAINDVTFDLLPPV